MFVQGGFDMAGQHALLSEIDALESQAVENGAAEDVARAAAVATRRLAASSRQVGPARMRAYFWAVVRRRSIRRLDSRILTAQLALESVVVDLMESGREPRQVWDELQRGWCDSVPPEVLESYRLRLCA
jgi:hypothetical protein